MQPIHSPDPLAPQNRSALTALCVLAVCMLLFHSVLPVAHYISELCGRIGLTDLVDESLIRAAIYSPATLIVGWIIMLFIMMTPLVAGHLSALYRQNDRANRPFAILRFLSGYLGVWTIAGFVLVPIGLANRVLYADMTPIVIALAFAALWSTLPMARCSIDLPSRDGRFVDGCRTAKACIFQCWPWMLVPPAFQTGHDVAMVLVAFVLIYLRSLNHSDSATSINLSKPTTDPT